MPSGGGANAFKDVILAVAIVGGVLGGLFLYTGVWPPMVVVESGSMMAPKSEVGYGKVGTIDPGDMVFVKKVDKRADILTLAEAQARGMGPNYGKPGDVLVYFPFNRTHSTPIIHRAMAWIEVENADSRCRDTGNPGSAVVYTVLWDGKEHSFGPSGIYLPTLGFGPPNYSDDRGYKPCWSGFITKGDNPVSNQFPDQAFGGAVLPNQPVQLGWIEGKAVGELPWFGLIKLALSGTENYVCTSNGIPVYRPGDPACENGAAVRILNANAPPDLWVMLGISLAAIAVAPLAYDMYVLRRQKQGGAGGSPPPPPPGEGPDWVARLKAKLGLAEDAPPDHAAGADPRAAFQPPPPAGAPAAKPPAPAAPSSPPPPGTTRFERVQKK